MLIVQATLQFSLRSSSPRRACPMSASAASAAGRQLGQRDAGRRPDPDRRRALAGDLPGGLAIVITVLGLNLLGDGLRDTARPAPSTRRR
ncbi:hypothetical protein ACRAWD_20270 [Caulobacter segnis]